MKQQFVETHIVSSPWQGAPRYKSDIPIQPRPRAELDEPVVPNLMTCFIWCLLYRIAASSIATCPPPRAMSAAISERWANAMLMPSMATSSIL